MVPSGFATATVSSPRAIWASGGTAAGAPSTIAPLSSAEVCPVLVSLVITRVSSWSTSKESFGITVPPDSSSISLLNLPTICSDELVTKTEPSCSLRSADGNPGATIAVPTRPADTTPTRRVAQRLRTARRRRLTAPRLVCSLTVIISSANCCSVRKQ